jgi:hypothetical protein
MTERHFDFKKYLIYICFDSDSMKKVTTFFLLGIFLFNTMGYFITFKVIQCQIKNEIKTEIKNGINLPELITITINKAQTDKIEWLENKEEMRYNNNRYDVVRFIENKESTTYYCINDTQEESLFTSLEKHVNTHVTTDKSTKDHTSKNLTDNVTKLYFSNRESLNFKTNPTRILPFFSTTSFYSSVLLDTDFVPPELI